MIGRASIGYPWIFNEIKHFLKTGEKLAPPTIEQRVAACLKHLLFSVQWKGNVLGIFEMRRHYTNYFKGLSNFKPYRMKLVESPSVDEIQSILQEIATVYQSDCTLSSVE
jgi:tRNA-dihydrouridine synthase